MLWLPAIVVSVSCCCYCCPGNKLTYFSTLHGFPRTHSHTNTSTRMEFREFVKVGSSKNHVGDSETVQKISRTGARSLTYARGSQLRFLHPPLRSLLPECFWDFAHFSHIFHNFVRTNRVGPKKVCVRNKSLAKSFVWSCFSVRCAVCCLLAFCFYFGSTQISGEILIFTNSDTFSRQLFVQWFCYFVSIAFGN